jgi:hypothetical protein
MTQIRPVAVRKTTTRAIDLDLRTPRGHRLPF